MQALQFHHATEPAQRVQKAMPKATGYDVVVSVEAVAVNPVDLKVKSTLQDLSLIHI